MGPIGRIAAAMREAAATVAGQVTMEDELEDEWGIFMEEDGVVGNMMEDLEVLKLAAEETMVAADVVAVADEREGHTPRSRAQRFSFTALLHSRILRCCLRNHVDSLMDCRMK
jgi:hypothetical protein